TLILNNLEYDHADIFPDLAAIETQFHHLVRTVPGNGLIVANGTGTDANLDRVFERGLWTPVERFGGVHPNGRADGAGVWSAGEVDADGHFDVFFDGTLQGRVKWSLIGEHNRMNALAAIAAARHAGVPAAVAVDALSRFENVKRRMEIRGAVHGITVYDDFAHHPTAIATTVEGLRAKVGRARILAVLEPRSNTMKLGVMKAALPDSLADADLVYCYGANLGWDATEALAPLGDKARVFDGLDKLVSQLVQDTRPGDHVLMMSNGGFGGIHARLLDALHRHYQEEIV
ncbi:MAG: glutamate ligase domain-containing protein, partial [Thiobacillus sp.]